MQNCTVRYQGAFFFLANACGHHYDASLNRIQE
jgi:hypothetical protein